MKHILAVLVLLAVLLPAMIRRVAPDPYVYDEADYMYAASLGFRANYTDTPTLPISDFLRTGLGRGRDASQLQSVSGQIRASGDVVFYRHWHGPLFLYLLIPVSRLGLNEQLTRSSMLAIPALTLTAMYFGCVWLIPGIQGMFAAILGGVLFLSSGAVIGSTELAPHQLFALISVCFLVLLLKFEATGNRGYWYAAVAAAAFAFCTLEVAFVLILTLLIAPRRGAIAKSLIIFIATVLIVWPGAIYKLSFVKGYMFMAYLAIFRKSPWGQQGFFDTWKARILDSPLEWMVILISLVIYFRNRNRPASLILIYAALMMLATARILSSTARYSLLFMPALDIFAALTLVPYLAALPRRAIHATAVLFCGLLALSEYRLLAGSRNPDPRPPSILRYIQAHGLEDKALLIPQKDLPMIHYYFPRTHLRGYYGAAPAASARDQFNPDWSY
jgi:hypothetical protein